MNIFKQMFPKNVYLINFCIVFFFLEHCYDDLFIKLFFNAFFLLFAVLVIFGDSRHVSIAVMPFALHIFTTTC